MVKYGQCSPNQDQIATFLENTTFIPEIHYKYTVLAQKWPKAPIWAQKYGKMAHFDPKNTKKAGFIGQQIQK